MKLDAVEFPTKITDISEKQTVKFDAINAGATRE